MTGGFLGVPTMRPNRCWAVLCVSILAGLALTLKADSEDSGCSLEIKVRRGTVYKIFLGQDLTINCTVGFCNNSQPAVSWYKIEKKTVPVNVSSDSHIRTQWKELNHLEGVSHLIFQNILHSDSGQYQCQSGNDVSHVINVSVDGDVEHITEAWTSYTTDSPTSHPETPDNLLLYVYSAAGIVAFVVIVIVISVISMRGCKGKPKKETQTENQYMAIPMLEQPFPQASVQPPPRESPSAPPPRRSTRRKAPPSQPTMTEDRERQEEEEEEEGGSVVYAALNHHPPPGAAARPWRVQEEYSEYAAIRVS